MKSVQQFLNYYLNMIKYNKMQKILFFYRHVFMDKLNTFYTI